MIHLFQPITMRSVTARNRVWIPPMCQYAAGPDGAATPWHVVHYGSFAKGGAGAIIVEATAVNAQGRISPRDLGLWDDAHVAALTPVVAFARSQGAAIGVQLAHAGRKASTYPGWGAASHGSVPLDDGGWQTVAPSAQAFEGLSAPASLDAKGLQSVIDDFVSAAERALAAGFDFVEIHAAHGYLLHEFLSPLSNDRIDEYGGSLENRARLLLAVVDAVRAAVGVTVPVLVRVSATDWVEGGVTADETATVAGWLAKHSVDLIDVSSGGNVAHAPIPVGPGYQLPLAAYVKERVSVPVAAVGLITEPVQAEQIIGTGQADVVLVGREALRDPHFALRAAAALGEHVGYVPGQYLRAY